MFTKSRRGESESFAISLPVTYLVMIIKTMKCCLLNSLEIVAW